jgi:uncharacterized protein
MNTSNSKGHVTTVIHHKVKGDKISQYQSWQKQIGDASKKYPGFMEIQVLNPSIITDASNEFVIIFSFTSDALLKDWLNSKERQILLSKTKEFSCEDPKVSSFIGFEHWFVQKDKQSRFKMTIVSFVAIWPLVHFIPEPLKVLALPDLAQETLTTAIITIMMSYVALPLSSRLFRRWL